MGFREDLAAAKEHVADERVRTVGIPVVVRGNLHEVFFFRAGTVDWSNATIKHLPRVGVLIDQRNGYDLTGATREIAPAYGRVLEGDEELVLSAEEWADMWEVMAPATARMIEANVWHLHERDAEQEIELAKKARKPARASKSKPN